MLHFSAAVFGIEIGHIFFSGLSLKLVSTNNN